MKIRLCLCAPLVFFVSQLSMAHVTLDQANASAGSYHKLTFKVGHGCDGSSTKTLIVSLPEGVEGAKPMPKPGWKLYTASVPLAVPYISHGKTVSQEVRVITWSGGLLPDAYYDEFSIQVKLPETEGKLYFNVNQLCENGRHDWVQIPGAGQSAHDLKEPAPVLNIQKNMSGEHQH